MIDNAGKQESLIVEKVKISDKDLLSGVRDGDQTAYSKLYSRYAGELLSYGKFLISNNDVIEDAVHDVFINIWSSRQNQIEINNIKSYLFISVRRAIFAKVKKNSKREFDAEILESRLGSQPSTEDSIINNELEEERILLIRNLINKLSDRQREIIFLRYFQNLNYDEISLLLEIDKKYAYNLTSKAFTYIKENLRRS